MLPQPYHRRITILNYISTSVQRKLLEIWYEPPTICVDIQQPFVCKAFTYSILFYSTVSFIAITCPFYVLNKDISVTVQHIKMKFQHVFFIFHSREKCLRFCMHALIFFYIKNRVIFWIFSKPYIVNHIK